MVLVLISFVLILESCGATSEHIFILKRTSPFESIAREYTNTFLPRGSFYENRNLSVIG